MQGGHGHGGYGGYGYYGAAGGYVYDAGAYYSADGYHPRAAAPAYGYEDHPLITVGRRAAHGLPAPQLDGLELQPSEACPKNYVVFDQTYTSSSVTFHPSLAHRLGGSSAAAASGHGTMSRSGDSSCSARQKEEDSEEIDALLSLSSEDGGGDDDDVASTGRSTPGSAYGGGDGTSSPDSACSSGKPRKKERIKKMMRALKGIVPGGDRMDTPAALDEAVWYLRSLKLEAAKKLGPRRSDT